MDRYGNKPSFGSYIFVPDKGPEPHKKHDPNDLNYDNLFDELYGNGIRVGQTVPDGLKVAWDYQYVKEGICGVVDCGKEQQNNTKLVIDKHLASGLIAWGMIDTEDENGKDFREDFFSATRMIEYRFNVPSLYYTKRQTKKAVFRFATTTLVISYYYPAPEYHSFRIQLYHNDVEHRMEKERAARGYTDWKLDDEWDEDLWLKQKFEPVHYLKGL